MLIDRLKGKYEDIYAKKLQIVWNKFNFEIQLLKN